MLLSNTDYKRILKYYNIDYKNLKNKNIKNMAEKILSKKLCKCIKSVEKKYNNENISIPICRNSVIKRKNLKIGSFKCKNKYKIYTKKKKSHPITKTKKNIYLGKKKN